MTVIYLNGKSTYVDERKLSTALDKMNISYYFSDISFCPHYVAYKEVVNNKWVTSVSNTSDGHFNNIKSHSDVEIIECTNLRDFVKQIYFLHYNKDNTNALF